VIFEELRAEGGPHPLGWCHVFDPHGNAVEGAEGSRAPGESGGGPSRLTERGLAIEGDHGVDEGIDPVQTLEDGPHHLERGDLAGTIEPGELGGRREAEIARHGELVRDARADLEHCGRGGHRAPPFVQRQMMRRGLGNCQDRTLHTEHVLVGGAARRARQMQYGRPPRLTSTQGAYGPKGTP
jgi:hypothetical protein